MRLNSKWILAGFFILIFVTASFAADYFPKASATPKTYEYSHTVLDSDDLFQEKYLLGDSVAMTASQPIEVIPVFPFWNRVVGAELKGRLRNDGEYPFLVSIQMVIKSEDGSEESYSILADKIAPGEAVQWDDLVDDEGREALAKVLQRANFGRSIEIHLAVFARHQPHLTTQGLDIVTHLWMGKR
jgi:hypothetical protein